MDIMSPIYKLDAAAKDLKAKAKTEAKVAEKKAPPKEQSSEEARMASEKLKKVIKKEERTPSSWERAGMALMKLKAEGIY